MESSKETIDLINIKCHDLKNQIAMLGSRIPKEEIEELNHTISIYDTTAKTGNEALDVLLAEKLLLCENKSIHFDYMADGENLSVLKPSDIYSLFGNASYNAIEAADKVEDLSRRPPGSAALRGRSLAAQNDTPPAVCAVKMTVWEGCVVELQSLF